MFRLLHRILYRLLPLEGYLRTVSGLFFLVRRLGIGRYAPATEYVFHLPELVAPGDTCIDIGANLGYYTRSLSQLAGPEGKVYAVEPVAPIRKVLSHNVFRCRNVEIVPFALGAANRPVCMGNDSVHVAGYMGTGRNFVNDAGTAADMTFTAEMRRGSELFAPLRRLDFIKCDIEGYEAVVLDDLRPLIERFRPRVLVETAGDNRQKIIDLFTAMDYVAFTLDRGREVHHDPCRDNGKDLIFRPKNRPSTCA